MCLRRRDFNLQYHSFLSKSPTSQPYVILVETGSLVENLHYGPFSRYWWEISSIPDSNTQLRFPIRVGQKTNVCLNERDFYITVQISSSNQMLPEYYCQSGEFWV